METLPPLRDESATLPWYHPAWPAQAGPLIPPAAATCAAIGCPCNGGPPERTTNLGSSQAFTRRLRSELGRALSRQGFQSPTPPPWGLSPAYSSPSQPLRARLSLLYPTLEICQVALPGVLRLLQSRRRSNAFQKALWPSHGFTSSAGICSWQPVAGNASPLLEFRTKFHDSGFGRPMRPCYNPA